MSTSRIDPWAVLGIAPTRDGAAIRKAYADRLKTTRPDVDPNAFRILREAFERARDGSARPAIEDETFQFKDHSPDAGQAPTRGDQAAVSLRAVLRDGKVIEAARMWAAAVTEGSITFQEQGELQTGIAAASLDDPGLIAADLDELTALMEWEDAARGFGASTAIVEVLRRRAALTWFAELQEAAALRPGIAKFAWRRRARGARIVLLPAPGRVRRHFPYLFLRASLPYWSAGLKRHRRFLQNRLNEERVEWCLRARRRLRSWIAARIFWIIAAIALVKLFVAIVGAVIWG